MCKNNDEFLYWVKAFVQLNTEERTGKKTGPRILTPILTPKNQLQKREMMETREQETHLGSGSRVTNKSPVLGQSVDDMDGPVRRAFRSHQQRPVIKTEGYQRATQQERDVAIGKDVDNNHKKSTVNLDDIKFIDEDFDDDGDNEFHVVRKSSDFKNVVESNLEDNCDLNFASDENAFTSKFQNTAHSTKASDSEKLEEKRANIRRLRTNLSNPYESKQFELKRCSITEKVDLRKAEIVDNHVSPNTTLPNDKTREEVDSKSESKIKYTNRANKNKNQGDVITGNLDDNASTTSMTGQHQHPARRENERSSANREHKTRDKKSSSGEKHSRARKNNLIGGGVDCEKQTIQSIQPDKSSVSSSSNGPVYIGHLAAKENIISGAACVKDKHSELNVEECETPEQIRENYKGLSDNESADEFLELKIDVNREKVARKETNKPTVSSIQPDILPRNERPSIRNFKSRSGINKQKSLRQKVLRKLGPRVSLSNSTPDLNAAIENETAEENQHLDLHSEEETDSPTDEIKLRRNTAFRNDLKLPQSTQLTKWLSEGDLLDAEDDEVDGRNMRTFKNVRKLTQDTFMETYGVVPRIKNGKGAEKKQKRHTKIQDINKNDLPGFTLYVDENVYPEDVTSQRRPSSSESSSGESSSYQASLTTSEPTTGASEVQKPKLSKSKSDDLHAAIRRPKSTGSDSSNERHSAKESSRNSWIASLTPHFARKAHKDSSTITSSTKSSSNQTSKKAVFRLPASNLTAAAHRGYLDRRNKKKQWERFWCVLQDSCLYCYNSPQSEFTQDAVVLRGYGVIADVTNLNRTRFPFRLERNGSPTLHFSSDSHTDFLLWAGTLEKETSNVQTGSTDNEVLVNSVKTTANAPRQENHQHHQSTEGNQISKMNESVDSQTPFETQKENLLRAVLAQQHSYIEEQKLLQERDANAKLTVLPDYSTKRISKDQVNEKYSRAKEEEELKMLKCLTHLNKRRNSAQLKVDQITKQLAPKSGRKRRENPQQFAEMENKLKQLQERLAMVDKEIQEKQAMKQDVIEKMHQRRDLELLILEQQESLDIIHRHQAQKKRSAFAQQTQPKESAERLSSIDEMSTISDCSSTSSNSLPDHLTMSLDSRTASTPRQRRIGRVSKSEDSTQPVHEGDSGFHRSTDMDDENISGVLSDDFRSMSTSSENDDATSSPKIRGRHASEPGSNANAVSSPEEAASTKRKDEVDPSILADIADFQLFSRQKLAKIHSSPNL